VTDVLSKAKRSQVMAAIRSEGNRATEGRLVAILREHGVTGWRRGQCLPGRPDFVFRRQKVAVFVDGCFWHACRWHCRMPKSNQTYWEPKISRNRRRDKEINQLLRERGWRVCRLWEHALRTPALVMSRLRAVLGDN